MRASGYAMAIVGSIVFGSAAAAPTPWSVTVPEGWEDVSVAAAQEPDAQKARKTITDLGGKVEFSEYQGPDGGSFFTMYTQLPTRVVSTRGAVRAFEEGARRSAGSGAGPGAAYTAREVNNLLIAEHVMVVPAGTLRIKRVTGVKDSHVVSLSGTCLGPEEVCTAALESMKIESSGIQPLVGDKFEGKSRAYRLGYTFGQLLIPIAICVVIWVLVRRRKKKQQST